MVVSEVGSVTRLGAGGTRSDPDLRRMPACAAGQQQRQAHRLSHMPTPYFALYFLQVVYQVEHDVYGGDLLMKYARKCPKHLALDDYYIYVMLHL